MQVYDVTRDSSQVPQIFLASEATSLVYRNVKVSAKIHGFNYRLCQM